MEDRATMTLILGAKGKDGVFLGSDTQGTDSEHYYSDLGGKLIRVKNYVIGYTASYRTAQIIEFNKDKFKEITTRKSMYDFVETLKNLIIEHGNKDKTDDKDELSHENVCLILGTNTKLYLVHSNYQFDEGSRFGVGSGGRYSMGYYDALPDSDTRHKITQTIKATAKNVSSVGNRVIVWKVK